MALTITQLAAAVRLGDGSSAPVEPVLSILTRLDGVSDAFLDLYASGAPSTIRDEAKVRLVGYLYDAPHSPTGDRYAAAWRNSGAGALVSPWRDRRAG